MPSQQFNKDNYIKGEDAYIELSQGQYALVDKDMLSLVLNYTWSLGTKNNYRWAQTNLKYKDKRTTLKLHHLIMGIPFEGYCIDHINGNPLDNRRKNLRLCKRSENAQNQTKIRGDINYRGVRRSGKRFRADITYFGERISLGVYNSAEEAAYAYNEAALAYRADYAALNDVSKSKHTALAA